MPGIEEPMVLPEVVQVTRDLIRIDTTNWGQGRAVGEREAADYVEAYLRRLDLEADRYEPVDRRTNLRALIPGSDRSRPALVLHGHLDVVPAIAEDWSVDPFAGVIRDGMLWGRGAVDMKNMNAMMLTAVGELIRSGETPPRDIILAFFADEEDGGTLGAELVVRDRPAWFAGADEAVSEVGGYSIDVSGRRAYLLQVGEKGLLWIRLVAHGRAGHGSGLHADNAVVRLSAAVAKLGSTEWPLELTPATTRMLKDLAALVSDPPASADEIASLSGKAAPFLRSTLRTTANPTGLTADYKHNVIPDRAEALVDVRVLPGQHDRVLAELQHIVGAVIDVEVVTSAPGLEVPFGGPLVEAMISALRRHDPDAETLPYLMGGGTDNKSLSRLGIRGYGFAPLRLPAELDFTGMFHGVDERVPLDALVFGQRVLTDFIRSA